MQLVSDAGVVAQLDASTLYGEFMLAADTRSSRISLGELAVTGFACAPLVYRTTAGSASGDTVPPPLLTLEAETRFSVRLSQTPSLPCLES